MPDDGRDSDQDLIAVLSSLRERGALGEVSLSRAVAHADQFVEALPELPCVVVDLGSGGGLPGLVIGWRRPDVRLVLTERRERRADLLRLAMVELGIDSHVRVLAGDVRVLAKDGALAGGADVVTARAFGEPLWTLECAVPFLRPDGMVVVSEPPVTDPDRWPSSALEMLGFSIAPAVVTGGVQVLHRV